LKVSNILRRTTGSKNGFCDRYGPFYTHIDVLLYHLTTYLSIASG